GRRGNRGTSVPPCDGRCPGVLPRKRGAIAAGAVLPSDNKLRTANRCHGLGTAPRRRPGSEPLPQPVRGAHVLLRHSLLVARTALDRRHLRRPAQRGGLVDLLGLVLPGLLARTCPGGSRRAGVSPRSGAHAPPSCPPYRFILPAGTAGIARLPESLAALGKSLLAALGLLGRLIPGRGSSRATRPSRRRTARLIPGQIRPRSIGRPGRRRFGASRVLAGSGPGPGTHLRVVTPGRLSGVVVGSILGSLPIRVGHILRTGSTDAAVLTRSGARICAARFCAGF